MTEKQAAILSSVLGVIVFAGLAQYVFSMTPVVEKSLGMPTINTRSNSIAYGAKSSIYSSQTGLLGTSVEYKTGLAGKLSELSTEQ